MTGITRAFIVPAIQGSVINSVNENEKITQEVIEISEDKITTEQAEEDDTTKICPACGSEEKSHSSKCSICGHNF